jgi:hypothetical protein
MMVVDSELRRALQRANAATEVTTGVPRAAPQALHPFGWGAATRDAR